MQNGNKSFIEPEMGFQRAGSGGNRRFMYGKTKTVDFPIYIVLERNESLGSFKNPQENKD